MSYMEKKKHWPLTPVIFISGEGEIFKIALWYSHRNISFTLHPQNIILLQEEACVFQNI